MRVGNVNQRAIADLAKHPAVQKGVSSASDAIVARAQALAPKATGEGAASIHSEPIEEGGEVVGQRVGWDEEHDYMRFPEFGTEKMEAEPFLRPAAHEVGGQ